MVLRHVLAIVLTTAAICSPAAAQTGSVTVNGYFMNPYDAIALGIPDGDYWLDPATGYYGYLNDPQPIGQLGAPQQINDPTGPGFNVRTLGGDLISDGSCSFIAGVPVGNC